ncbi:DUF6660 family protein [Spirosoma linguale]|uniref:Uncharacterized protein n=1 Tax=Spirosoma linguale (strain ATCC 33905 / DSM 74 / LMG 10896 / Claus 1) TaxID=504472 RepID=D2QV90_SPILD|nr:hypothetical protein Slin_6770 [Spirosoma linguale DSM 74]
MKWFTILFSVYLLGLSLWPCADELLFPAGQSEIAVLSPTTPSSNTDRTHQNDACTPFCTCACCAATITVAPRSQYALLPSNEIVPISVATFSYASAHPLTIVTAIWQPPKLRV